MIVTSCEVLDEVINVETNEGEFEIDKSEFETWVDENARRIVLVENFNGSYNNHDEHLSWEQFYEHIQLHRELEWFLSVKQ